MMVRIEFPLGFLLIGTPNLDLDPVDGEVIGSPGSSEYQRVGFFVRTAGRSRCLGGDQQVCAGGGEEQYEKTKVKTE